MKEMWLLVRITGSRTGSPLLIGESRYHGSVDSERLGPSNYFLTMSVSNISQENGLPIDFIEVSRKSFSMGDITFTWSSSLIQ